MLNSSHIQRKIEQGPKIRSMFQRQGGGQQTIQALYLTVLSRYPTEEESRTVGEYYRSFAGNKRDALVDIVWALINSTEFLYRH